MASDIEIARAAKMRPILEIAQNLDIPPGDVHQYGPWNAKISLDHVRKNGDKAKGRLIMVTAMTPTTAGEGKSTTTVGLGDGLNRIGK
jgi:formate--tetrahydrofolate ligase